MRSGSPGRTRAEAGGLCADLTARQLRVARSSWMTMGMVMCSSLNALQVQITSRFCQIPTWAGWERFKTI